MLKHTSFSSGRSVRLDDRAAAMLMLRFSPLGQILTEIYAQLYSLTDLKMKPNLAALDDWDHNLYDKSPTIQNVKNTGAPANNCGVISSITVLLAIEEIRKLLQRKAMAAEQKAHEERTLRDKFCYGLREMCLRQTDGRPTDSMARGKQLTNLCLDELSFGSGEANTLEAFRRIIQ
ncbi:unnamed protein product, partial [Mesorhabditis belari]|uniref:Uncharacterized protein n=1 Tax=Mesorhabditis belari TaxID=2138241 RepID=A0AAF3F519_9BILA